MTLTVLCGDICYEDAEEAAIEKRRTVLIIQNDIGNQFAPHTIIAAIHGDTGKRLPVFVPVPVPKGVGGLTKDSLVDCGHIATISRERLGNPIGHLPQLYMSFVDKALKISLQLK